MPYPRETQTALCESWASGILKVLPCERGYCLDLGCGDGRLAHAIAERTGFTVVGVEDDPERAAAAREAAERAGLYGTRIVIHEGSLAKLPYPKYVFNVIVSRRTLASGELPPPAEEVHRVLRPYGGTLCLGQWVAEGNTDLSKERLVAWLKSGRMDATRVRSSANKVWTVVRRGRLTGGGDWSHQYANAANTTCSEDTRVGRPLQLLWYGRPGPRRMFDRHSFAHGPICVGGRLFTAGENVLYASDAYNGTSIWTAEITELAPRVNVARDSGFVAANDEHVFVAAADRCLCLDAATGKRLPAYVLPRELRAIRPPMVLADFEGEDYGEWTVEGEAFGRGPASGTFPKQHAVRGFKGHRFVNTFLGGSDAKQGKLTSPTFKIERPFLTFLIGGGQHEGKACINLAVDGKIVRTATGANRESLHPHAWAVEDLIGRNGRIEIVDAESGGWGHINVDQIEQRDRAHDHKWGYIQQNVPLERGEPFHIVVTYQGSRDDDKALLTCYRNGRLAGRMTTALELRDVEDTDNRLGGFAGTFDELRVYDYALTLGEVRGSYQAGPNKLRLAADENESDHSRGAARLSEAPGNS